MTSPRPGFDGTVERRFHSAPFYEFTHRHGLEESGNQRSTDAAPKGNKKPPVETGGLSNVGSEKSALRAADGLHHTAALHDMKAGAQGSDHTPPLGIVETLTVLVSRTKPVTASTMEMAQL